MTDAITRLFAEHGINPVLVEVGPRDRSPQIWDGIAPVATYVAAGPEAHLNQSVLRRSFRVVHTLDELVMPEKSTAKTALHVTRDPVYSSALPPKPASSRGDHGFLDRKEIVPSTTLNQLAARLELPAIDWLNTNVNGLDSRLYASLDSTLRRRLLALDTVVDVVHFWEAPGSSASVLQQYVDDGFWLSACSSFGLPRIRPESMQRLQTMDASLDGAFFSDSLKRSPGWLFVRLFKSLESMASGEFAERDYVVLWTFAMVDRQWGFAADVAFEYGRLFGEQSTYHAMVEATLDLARRFTGERRRTRGRTFWSRLFRRVSL